MNKVFSINNVSHLLLIIAGLIFLYWYLPVAFSNVYVCDDYWFGTNVSNYGFWGNQMHYWLNWEGSYTHTFLDSLPHTIKFIRIPFCFNLISLGLLIYSLSSLIRSLFNISVLDAGIVGLYISSILYTFTNGSSEIRFWVSANAYIIELALVLFAISLYHKKETNNSKRWYVYMTFLLFAISGCKLTFIMYTIVGFVLHDLILKIKPNKQTYFIFGILFLFSFVNVLAPGNFIRLQEETNVYHSDVFTLYDILKIRFDKILSFIGCSLLLIPASFNIKSYRKISLTQVLLCAFVLVATFILDSIIMYVCFRDPGPLRVYVLFEIMILIIVLCFCANISTKLSISNFIRVPLSLILLFAFIIYNIPLIEKKQGSIEFAKQARLRDQKIVSAPFSEVICIDPLPDSHLLLSYFINDEGWLENVYLPYFGKSCKIIINDSDRDGEQ